MYEGKFIYFSKRYQQLMAREKSQNSHEILLQQAEDVQEVEC
jgi:hypothetical protein